MSIELTIALILIAIGLAMFLAWQGIIAIVMWHFVRNLLRRLKATLEERRDE